MNTPRPTGRAGKLYTIELPYSLLMLNAETIVKAHAYELATAKAHADDAPSTTEYRRRAAERAERLEALYFAITGEAVPA